LLQVASHLICKTLNFKIQLSSPFQIPPFHSKFDLGPKNNVVESVELNNFGFGKKFKFFYEFKTKILKMNYLLVLNSKFYFKNCLEFGVETKTKVVEFSIFNNFHVGRF